MASEYSAGALKTGYQTTPGDPESYKTGSGDTICETGADAYGLTRSSILYPLGDTMSWVAGAR